MGTVERVRAGTVRSVNPARRELRVDPDPAHAHEFDGCDWLRVVPADGQELRCRVSTIRCHGDEVIVMLTPGVPRDTVALMKGAAVVLTPEECAVSPDTVWRVTDWVGWQVVGMDGASIGAVAEVFATPANAAFAVRRSDGGGVTLPAVPEVVVEIDGERGLIRVRDIERYGVEL